MEETYNCVIMHHGLAFGTGAVIFLITLLLVSRRVIGFFLSLLLMLIALGASLGIEHQDLIKSYINKWISGKPAEAPVKPVPTAPVQPPAQAPGEAQPKAPTPPKPAAAPEHLKGQAQSQKQKIEQFLQNRRSNLEPAPTPQPERSQQ